jgi:hypothetical protein
MQAFAERVFAPRRPSAGLGAVDAGFPAALWNLYDKTGIRPEWVVPVLYAESGLNPASVNSLGCVGINQACPNAMAIPAGYTGWTASQQMNGLVTPMFQTIQTLYDPIRSGTRCWQANILPATLPSTTHPSTKRVLPAAPYLSSIIATKTSPCPAAPQGGNYYCANRGLDYTNKGTITVSDLAHFISLKATVPYVKSVIASAYAVAPPGAGPETDPTYGTDFPNPSITTAAPTDWAVPLTLAGSAIAVLLAYDAYRRSRPITRRRYVHA